MKPDERAGLTRELARLGAGDRSRAKVVFETLWPILLRFCSRWLRGAAEADDCAQRAITRVFAQAPMFDAHRDALTWALELATWECRTERSRLLRARHEPLSKVVSVAEGTTEQGIEQRELSEALLAAMADLSPADRVELERVLKIGRAHV